MQPHSDSTAGVVAPPPLLFGASWGLGLLAHTVVPWRLKWRPARQTGSVVGAAGAALALWALWTLRRAGTDARPEVPTRTLVVHGPFRLTRNPIYLGLTLVSAGAALRLGTVWPAALLPAVLMVLNRGVIDREERYLAGLFGEAYKDYHARVRRWL